MNYEDKAYVTVSFRMFKLFILCINLHIYRKKNTNKMQNNVSRGFLGLKMGQRETVGLYPPSQTIKNYSSFQINNKLFY